MWLWTGLSCGLTRLAAAGDAQSQRRVGASVVGLARLSANGGIDLQDADFTFAAATRARGADERLDDLPRLFIRRDDLDAQLLLELAKVWRAPVEQVSPTHETARFRDGHPGKTFYRLKRAHDFVQDKRLNHCCNNYHLHYGALSSETARLGAGHSGKVIDVLKRARNLVQDKRLNHRRDNRHAPLPLWIRPSLHHAQTSHRASAGCGNPEVASTFTSSAPGTRLTTAPIRSAVFLSVSRSSPKSLIAMSERTPEISSETRSSIGCEKLKAAFGTFCSNASDIFSTSPSLACAVFHSDGGFSSM